MKKMSDYNQIIAAFNKMNVGKLRDKFTTCSLKLLKSMKNEFDNRYYTTGEESIDDLRYDILVEVLEERNMPGQNRGFCFLEFYNHACAVQAKKTLTDPDFK